MPLFCPLEHRLRLFPFFFPRPFTGQVRERGALISPLFFVGDGRRLFFRVAISERRSSCIVLCQTLHRFPLPKVDLVSIVDGDRSASSGAAVFLLPFPFLTKAPGFFWLLFRANSWLVDVNTPFPLRTPYKKSSFFFFSMSLFIPPLRSEMASGCRPQTSEFFLVLSPYFSPCEC